MAIVRVDDDDEVTLESVSAESMSVVPAGLDANALLVSWPQFVQQIHELLDDVLTDGKSIISVSLSRAGKTQPLFNYGPIDLSYDLNAMAFTMSSIALADMDSNNWPMATYRVTVRCSDSTIDLYYGLSLK